MRSFQLLRDLFASGVIPWFAPPYGANGSIWMIVPPCWSPSHMLERAPDFCTSTCRTLVSCGSRYSVNSPVWVFSRRAISLSMPAPQSYALSSNSASYGRVHCVGAFHCVIFWVLGSNITRSLPLKPPHHSRSCESIWPRRQPISPAGMSYHTVFSVFPSVIQILGLVKLMPYMLFFESATTS